MKTLLFVHGGAIRDNKPIAHFLLRLNAAISYSQQHSEEEVVFLVSGRGTNIAERHGETEAEIGKNYIIEHIPDAIVYKEEISTELIGNYAFSKPLIQALTPDMVVIPTSELLLPRNQRITERIFASDFSYRCEVITNDLSDNKALVEKEASATKLFDKLFAHVTDGDDAWFRNVLLYDTPYYFKGVIDDKEFFDKYWEGGYKRFLDSRSAREATQQPKG